MSRNKDSVRKYMDAFGRTDRAYLLSCLTDDVEWVMPGAFHLTGKDAVAVEIESHAFAGSFTITVTRMTEEDDVVVAEGSVRGARCDDGMLHAAFCDIFVMRDAKIRHLTSYLVELPAQADGAES